MKGGDIVIIPFMTESLVFIPKTISYGALILLFIAGIREFRQGYIGRIGIASNAFLLWQIFYSDWLRLPEWFQWYLNVGSILAIIAIPSYLFRIRLPSEFYQISFLGYSSISIIVAIIIPFII